MKPRDILLAVAVTATWGVNFVVIEVGLGHYPPLLFNALRFSLAAVPAIFFVGRPQVPWRWILAVAGTLAVTKFSLLFAGMAAGMPAGLSSLVLQSQAVFTLIFAVLFLRERPRTQQIAGLAVAAAGIGLVATRVGGTLPVGAFLLVIGAAVAWGLANIATRQASPPDTLRFMVWVSAAGALPLAVLSLLVEGPATGMAALRATDLEALGSLLFVALISTLAGFGGWGFLIRRYGASTVAPFSMLVPVFGLASAAVFLGEAIHPSDLAGAALVIGGVLIGAISVPGRRSGRRVSSAAANGVSAASGSAPVARAALSSPRRSG